MTIREIYEMVKADGEEFLDAELYINVRGCGKNIGRATTARDLWGFPRSASNSRTGEKAHIAMDVNIQGEYLLVKRKK